MPRKRFKLTNESVREKCLPPPPAEINSRGKPVTQKIYWDSELSGFGIVVGHRTKSYVVQKSIRRRSVRVTIGRHGAWTPTEARKRARELIVEMDKGINPNHRKRKEAAKGVTLAEAVEMHSSAMLAKGTTERSIQTIHNEIARYLGDWLRRPLAEITPNDCAQRHVRITKNNGPYAANRAFSCLRACYNSARKRHRDLLENPVNGITFNRIKRRREPISWSALAAWHEKVQAIDNPIRRDLQLFFLFTGLRSEDARTVRWEHIDFEAVTLHRPKPKGGEDRAFTVPISKYVLQILLGRRDENSILFRNDHGWVFPTRNRKGRVTYIQEAKEQRYVDGRKVKHLPSPHRLRDTFATAAHEARIHPLDLKVLMNHTMPHNSDDVTEGYIRPSVEHLRKCQEQITEFLLERMPAGN